MKKIVLILISVFFFLGLAQSAFSQSAEKISEILEIDEISKGQAAYFICVYGNFTGETVSDNEAFDILTEKKLFDENENISEKTSLSKACFIIAKSLNMKGGLLYSIFGSPRYALREFKADGIVPQNSDPNQKVSGSEFIALLSGFEKNMINKGR